MYINIINSHNKKILEAVNKTKRKCNCRNKTNCPFNGEYLLKEYNAKGEIRNILVPQELLLKQDGNNISIVFL